MIQKLKNNCTCTAHSQLSFLVHLLPDEAFKEKKSFLDHYAEPWDQVCTLWKETSPNRLKQLLQQEDSNLATTMKTWPLFKHPSAPTLV